MELEDHFKLLNL